MFKRQSKRNTKACSKKGYSIPLRSLHYPSNLCLEDDESRSGEENTSEDVNACETFGQ